MSTTAITAEDIIGRYADDIAYVTEETPATDLGTFIDQLYTAARRFGEGGINGHEDVETAAILLGEACSSTDETECNVFLTRADNLLTDVWDMTQDYRLMVGD